MMIDFENLNCNDCPASRLLDIKRIKDCENLREVEIKSILKRKHIKLFLLCESLPAKGFVYDRSSDCSRGSLRYNLRNELVNRGTDKDLFDYLRKHGIIIIDCALCPLHKLINKRSEISSDNMSRASHQIFLDLNPKVPIVTIFPSRCGFLKRKMPRIQDRVKYKFQFKNLKGLKNAINTLLVAQSNFPA